MIYDKYRGKNTGPQFFKTHRPIILPVVLYGCEILSLTTREEYWLRLFKNRVQRGIFGTWRHEVNRKMEKTT
jgi:hypothetical protein